MDSGDSSSSTVLTTDGVDFSNATQAGDFLDELLDDTYLQVDGNHYATYFWYAVCVFIGIVTICRLISLAILRSRLRASRASPSGTPQQRNIFIKCFMMVATVVREVSNVQITPVKGSFWLQIPPLGTVLVIVGYLALIMIMEFANNDIQGAQYLEGLGVRAGWLAVAQVPLLILLAGKNSLIGLFVGASYDKLNIYHRWVSRGLLILATFHFGFQAWAWDKYHVFSLEWTTDECIPTGLAVYAILVWLNISSFAPLRRLSYEFFIIQHILTFIGFIVAIMYHLPDTAYYSRVYIFIPIVLYFLDRVVRTARYAYHNMRPAKATLENLDDQATRIRVSSKQLKKWAAGSHVLLAIPRFGLVQSHPATILSTPTSHDGDLVFILKSHKGFTRRVLKSCSCEPAKPGKSEALTTTSTRTALIDGPYAHAHADFAAFDTLILVCGGTGITFTLSALLDLAHRASTSQTPLPLRTVDFVWIIKRKSWINWVSDELQTALTQLQHAGIDVQMRIHITCDDTFVESSTPLWLRHGGSGARGCQCAKGPGKTCCCGSSPPAQGISRQETSSSSATANEKQSSTRQATTVADEKNGISTAKMSMTSSHSSDSSRPANLPISAIMHKGRPSLDPYTYFWPLLDTAEGETAVAVCGPLGLSRQVHNAVVKVSDERACWKGTGAYGVYLWVEQFGM